MLSEKQITESCKIFGIGDEEIGNIIESLGEDSTKPELGYIIFQKSGKNTKKREIVNKLGIKYDALDLKCKNFGAKRKTWAKKAVSFYEENKNKKYKTSETGELFVNSLDYLEKPSFERDILEYCKKETKLFDIRKNFKYPHCVHDVSKMLQSGFLEEK